MFQERTFKTTEYYNIDVMQMFHVILLQKYSVKHYI